jgi:hypothetical protein
MESREFCQYFKWCVENGIKIFPIPLHDKSENYKICVERNGAGSVGQRVFENQPKGKDNSVWEQIRELYKIIYKRDNILPLMDYSYLPIEQQIVLTKEDIKNSENHIKHYSNNPLQLDELRFKIQEQGLQAHNNHLHKRLEKLEIKFKTKTNQENESTI